MSQKKSTKKAEEPPKDIKVTLIRFKDADALNSVREAAAMEDVSLNKFMVRSVIAAASRVKDQHKPAKA